MFATDKVTEFIGSNGDTNNDILIKTDQEEAIQALVRDVVIQRPSSCKTLVEEAPVKQSKSNGLVERAVQEVEGGIRAIKHKV